MSCLTLDDVTYDHAGKYEISVKNSLGKERRFFSLAVKGESSRSFVFAGLTFLNVRDNALRDRISVAARRSRDLDLIKLNYMEFSATRSTAPFHERERNEKHRVPLSHVQVLIARSSSFASRTKADDSLT